MLVGFVGGEFVAALQAQIQFSLEDAVQGDLRYEIRDSFSDIQRWRVVSKCRSGLAGGSPNKGEKKWQRGGESFWLTVFYCPFKINMDKRIKHTTFCVTTHEVKSQQSNG